MQYRPRIIAQVAGVTPGTHLLTVSIDPERRIITGLNLEIGLKEPSEPRKILTAAHLRTSGMAAYSRGQYAAARILFERAVTLAVRQNDSYLAALTHNSLGAINQDEYKFKEAGQEFKKPSISCDRNRNTPTHWQRLWPISPLPSHAHDANMMRWSLSTKPQSCSGIAGQPIRSCKCTFLTFAPRCTSRKGRRKKPKNFWWVL